MNKNEKINNFNLSAPYVYEDGTYDSLIRVVEKHEQNDIEIIKKAANEISRFIRFNMEHSVDYWNEDKKEYVHFPKKGENIDFKNQKINFFMSKWEKLGCIHIDEEVEDKELKALLKIKKEVIKANESPTEDDKKRWKMYGRGNYCYILSKMLEENFYFEDLE